MCGLDGQETSGWRCEVVDMLETTMPGLRLLRIGITHREYVTGREEE